MELAVLLTHTVRSRGYMTWLYSWFILMSGYIQQRHYPSKWLKQTF